MQWHRRLIALGIVLAILPALRGERAARVSHSGLPAALEAREWARVERAVDRGLAWLSKQQQRDGSFEGRDLGQPAITSLAVMAYLSRGHRPGAGPYGKALERAIDFVLGTQRANGLFTFVDAPPPYEHRKAPHTATYNHAIAGLMLGEVYGMCRGPRSEKIRTTIERALDFSWGLQFAPKTRPEDRGGWRYLYKRDAVDSDLSVTGWQLMFLRSAKNAEFDVPKEFIDAAMQYVMRCYIADDDGTFTYSPGDKGDANEAMTGIGALSLSLGGLYDDRRVIEAGEWLLEHPLDGDFYRRDNRYLYTAYYCTQAMAQLGGRYWERFFPVVAQQLVVNQKQDGHWYVDHGRDKSFGKVYFTSLALLTLTPPYQLLPIYQR